jgi:transglutaminase-like putative cysteine protease
MKRGFTLPALVITCWLVAGGDATLSADSETIYYAVKSKGVTCGSSTTTVTREEFGGHDELVLVTEVRVKLTLMGAPVETVFRSKEHVDPESGQFRLVQTEITQGQGHLESLSEVVGAEVRVTSRPDGKIRMVTLPNGAILENSLFVPHLVRDFVTRQLDKQSYQVFDTLDGNLHQTTYTKIGTERITLAGRQFEAVVLDKLDQTTGQKVRSWIDVATARQLRADYPNRSIILAEASASDSLRAAKIDDRIFAKVDVSIPNISDISYLRVKAVLVPTGAWITPDDLNVPGQTFHGTVKDNRIDGVFEISHPRYDGRNAPPFPPDFQQDERVNKYLLAEELIESEDPTLAARAREISAGAKNSWEAATRLARWVAEEIRYALPGGVSARNTLELKMGECGAHSLLMAAFCRAVGIPARVVWGCMYVPNAGGAFGQHGWSEVFMGEAGWIPLDTTAHEIDFIDSGHIRLGVLASRATAFGPESLEILDYRTHATASAAVAELEPFVGSYSGRRGPLKIRYQSGGLVLDIPGRMALELRDPGPDGIAVCKLTSQVSVAFQKDASGKVTGMTVRSSTLLPRSPGSTTGSDPVPAELQPYVGTYPAPGRGTEFKVAFEGGGLVFRQPGQQAPARLLGPDSEGVWTGDSGRIKISFVRTGSGGVSALVIHEAVENTKVETETAEKR